MNMMNADRADAADKALATFTRATWMQGEDYETRISDLVTDLIHLCDREGVVFDDVITRAKQHHRFELEDES